LHQPTKTDAGVQPSIPSSEERLGRVEAGGAGSDDGHAHGAALLSGVARAQAPPDMLDPGPSDNGADFAFPG
jgi:hypothetical protein